MVAVVIAGEIIAHESKTSPSTYWIVYGDKTFQWQKNIESDCRSVLLRKAGTKIHYVVVASIGSLDKAIDYVRENYSSGITVAPAEDRRGD